MAHSEDEHESEGGANKGLYGRTEMVLWLNKNWIVDSFFHKLAG